MIEIELREDGGADRELWDGVGDLVELLPTDWVLIGGLMVQLHALEHGVRDVRATRDIDVLGQARPQGTLPEIDAALCRAGFQPVEPDLDNYAFRYVRDELVVDILAPDGLKPAPRLDAARKAIGVPGGSQALARAETVAVRFRDRTFNLRRPTLLGAILIKARALRVHHDADTQREDLLLLLSLVEDPRAIAVDLGKAERRWLRQAEPLLRFAEPVGLRATNVGRARQTLRLLSREP